MATENVDEILWMVYEAGAKSMEDSGGSDHEVNEAKTALDGYYTRECARKVLEIIGEDEHYSKDDPMYSISGEPFEWAVRNAFRAELRAAIKDTK